MENGVCIHEYMMHVEREREGGREGGREGEREGAGDRGRLRIYEHKRNWCARCRE